MACNAINAPALLFGAVGQLFWRKDHGPTQILGVALPVLLFYAGIVVVWYFVGRWLDECISPARHEKKHIAWTGAIYKAFLVTLGVAIFLGGALPSLTNPGQFNNPVGNHVAAIFYLAWSVALVLFPMANLVKGLRRKTASPIG